MQTGKLFMHRNYKNFFFIILTIFSFGSQAQPAIDYYNEGLKAFQQKNIILAIFSYTQPIQANPFIKETYNQRAVAYNEQKKYHRALRDYDQAIVLDSSYAIAYLNRANVKFKIEGYIWCNERL